MKVETAGPTPRGAPEMGGEKRSARARTVARDANGALHAAARIREVLAIACESIS